MEKWLVLKFGNLEIFYCFTTNCDSKFTGDAVMLQCCSRDIISERYFHTDLSEWYVSCRMVYIVLQAVSFILSRVLFRYLLSPSLPVHNPLSVMVHVTGIDALVFLKSNTRLILSRFRLFFAVF